MKALVKDRIDYWFKSAKYDLTTARSMFREKRYLYVGFCCHLTIEKILKAYYWKVLQNEPPFTHNLNLLLSITRLSEQITKDDQAFIDELMPLNIKARYPENKERIRKILTSSRSKIILRNTEELYSWIRTLLRQ